MWANASGCIDMMPFLLRSLRKETDTSIRHAYDVTSSAWHPISQATDNNNNNTVVITALCYL